MHLNGGLESCRYVGGLLLVVRTLSSNRLSGENIWKIQGIAILEDLDNYLGLLSAVTLVTCSEYCQKGIKDGDILSYGSVKLLLNLKTSTIMPWFIVSGGRDI